MGIFLCGGDFRSVRIYMRILISVGLWLVM